jgi:hypothetical protein
MGGIIFLEVQVIKGGMGGEAAEYMAFYDHSSSKGWDESRRSIGRTASPGAGTSSQVGEIGPLGAGLRRDLRSVRLGH